MSLAIASTANASLGADDTAANSAYDSGWANATTTTSTGTWGSAWSFTQSSGDGGQNGRFVGSSFSNDDGDVGNVNINTSSRAWAMYANSGNTVTATRQFSGAMTAGQSFRVDMDNGNVANNGASTDENRSRTGFKLLDSSSNVLFEFRFRGGDSTYTYKRSTSDTPTSTGVNFTRGGLRAEFSLVDSSGNPSASNFRLKVWRPNNAASSTTIFSSLLQAGTNIDRVLLFNKDAGGGGTSNVYFNSISIPEPATFSVVGGLLLAALGSRRRQANLSV